MKKVKLENTFHGTFAIVIVPDSFDADDAWFYLQDAKNVERGYGTNSRRYSRVVKALCGMSDCVCGGYRPR